MMKSILYVAILANIIAATNADLNLITGDETPRGNRKIRGGKMNKRRLGRGHQEDRELGGILTSHSKKYHSYGVLYSKKKSRYGYWRTDSRDRYGLLLGVPFIPFVMFTGVAMTVNQCSCGGIGSNFGQDDVCDCLCYCDSINPDLIPVSLEEGVTYDPAPDFINPDSSTCGCVVSDVFQPVAQSDTFFTDVGTPITFDPTANDFEVNNKPLTIMSFDQPNNGLVVENFDGTLIYTPDIEFEGVDSFDYVISNGDGGFGTGTTTIVVGNPSGVSGITLQATPLTISPNDVLGSDISQLVPLADVNQPNNGVISWDDEGNLIYTPDPDFTGTDTFEFSVLDSDGNPSFLDGTIVVQPVDSGSNTPTDFNFGGGGLGELSIGGLDPPKPATDVFITNLDTALTLSPSDIISNDQGVEVRLEEIFQPQSGTITEGPNGSFIYTPNPGFSGTDTFSYTISDNSGQSATSQVSIIVNRPPNAMDDSFSTLPNRPLTINKEQVLGNDFDPDGDIIAIESNTRPTNGRVVLRPLVGGFLYTPNNGFKGIDSFEYIISDGNGGFGKATIIITVADKLTAIDDNYSTAAYTEFTVPAPGILENDLGFELQVLSYRQPLNGAVFVSDVGAMTYAPNSDWVGMDSFVYTVIDSTGSSSTAVVSIYVESLPPLITPGMSPLGPSNAPGLCRRYTTDTLLDQNYAIDCNSADTQGHYNNDIILVDTPDPPPKP